MYMYMNIYAYMYVAGGYAEAHFSRLFTGQ